LPDLLPIPGARVTITEDGGLPTKSRP
jgi:hypothetical protein